MIKKIVTGALAALTLGGVAIAGPASAEGFHGGYHGGGHGDRAGVAIGAGIVGLALGAALASSHDYGPRPAYYAYGCPTHWAWDRYVGRYVRVSDCYR